MRRPNASMSAGRNWSTGSLGPTPECRLSSSTIWLRNSTGGIPGSSTASPRDAAREFLERLKERTENRDKPVWIAAFNAQLKAIHAWGRQRPADLSRIHHPVLVANGDHDRMVPSSNSVDLARRLPNAELVLYEDAGHGGVFQYHQAFVKKALEFLEA